MQMCPECEKIYDESEYCKCPYCHPEGYGEQHYIVYDADIGKALELTKSEFEDFKKTHPDYR